jgi:hypothetical protein
LDDTVLKKRVDYGWTVAKEVREDACETDVKIFDCFDDSLRWEKVHIVSCPAV